MLIQTKLGRDIARDKRHLVCEFDPKQPWPWEMVVTLVSEITFCTFPKYFLGISTKLDRVIARGKGHHVREFDLKRY